MLASDSNLPGSLGPVLVTGATGFIGANVARRLSAGGADVHIVLRAGSDTRRIDGLSLCRHACDLLDRAGVKEVVSRTGPAKVFHFASYGGHYFENDPQRILQVNLEGTLNLMQAAAESGTGCFVNSGSSSEYGRKSRPMSETDTLEPSTVYGAAKAAATLAAQAFGLATDMRVITIRPFSPYGPFDAPDRLIPSVIARCLAGEDLRLASPHTTRDFVFIDDVVELYLRVAEDPGQCEVLNCGSGIQRTVAEVVDAIVTLVGRSVRQLWGEAPPRPHEADCWVADISKAARLYDWKPKFTLEDGLERTIHWQRSEMTG